MIIPQKPKKALRQSAQSAGETKHKGYDHKTLFPSPDKVPRRISAGGGVAVCAGGHLRLLAGMAFRRPAVRANVHCGCGADAPPARAVAQTIGCQGETRGTEVGGRF